jgi:hypothetical protein
VVSALGRIIVGVIVALVAYVVVSNIGDISGPLIFLTIVMTSAIYLSLITSPRRQQVQAIIGVGLLVGAVFLTSTSLRAPPLTNGSLLNILVLSPHEKSTPPLVNIHFFASLLRIDCIECSADSSVMLGFVAGDIGPHPLSFRPVGDTKINTYGPVNTSYNGTDVVVDSRAWFLEFTSPAFVEVPTDGAFIGQGATRTVLNAPVVAKPYERLLTEADRVTNKRWMVPAEIRADVFAGSTEGPAGGADGEYAIDRASPEPSASDRFFIHWGFEAKKDSLIASAVLSSPARESSATQRTILAGALAGAAAVPLMDALAFSATAFIRRARKLLGYNN